MQEIELWKMLLLAGASIWFAFQLGKQYGIKEEAEIQRLRGQLDQERDPPRRHELLEELDQAMKNQSPRLFKDASC